MRYIAILVLTSGLSFTATSLPLANAEDRCLSQHLKDTIQLNQSRLSKYSELTQGKSERISVICDDLVSMTSVPEFSEKSQNPVDPISQLHPLNTREITRSIRDAFHSEGFEGISRTAHDWLQLTNQTPSYHCLVRHFLESILRAANLAPTHIAQGKRAGLFFEPAHLSWQLIELQLLGLGELEKIDELAAPIQAQGIPILCQDVPQIPPGL